MNNLYNKKIVYFKECHYKTESLTRNQERRKMLKEIRFTDIFIKSKHNKLVIVRI